jgi:hypothetical protein
VQGKDTK